MKPPCFLKSSASIQENRIKETRKRARKRKEAIGIFPRNGILFQLEHWEKPSSSVSSLRRSQETRPGKRISDFRQKSRRAFRLKRLEGRARRERNTAAGAPPQGGISRIRADYVLISHGGAECTNLRDTCWTWGFLRSPASLCSVVHKRLDFISLVAEEKIFIKLYLITLIWNKCGWTDWSFQATVTGPHLWDNIQTAISPGALL